MWEMDDNEPEEVAFAGGTSPTLVSLHFMREALRRRWAWWLTGVLIGLIGASLFLVVVPTQHTADAALYLAHDPDADPDGAMATDVSLATTRVVAAQTVARLGLRTSATRLRQDVAATPTTTSVMTISMKGPSGKEAVRRLEAFTSVFLTFRAKQLTTQSSLLSRGSNEQIDKLQAQSQDVTEQIDKLVAKGQGDSTQVGTLIDERSDMQTQITGLQQSVEDSNLRATAIIAGSRILDQPSASAGSGLKRPVLVVLTALIACTALAVGLVLLTAILSDKLHSRIEVATALEAPVATSVGKVLPISKVFAWLPWLRRQNRRRADDLQRLAGAIRMAVPEKSDGQWLAVGCIDNSEDIALGVVLAAAELQRRGRVVRVVDMTEEGLTEVVLEAVRGNGNDLQLAISRPKTPPSLARDVSDIMTYGPETRDIPSLTETDVFLTVADIDPSVGAYHLSAWANRVVMAVTAGRSSAERVRTAAELVRSAGLELYGGIMIGSDRRDVSSGAPLRISPRTDADWR